MAQIPNHDNWKKFKKAHNVGSNMVGSVNVGKALDTYHKKFHASNMKVNAALAADLAKELTIYKSKFPNKNNAYNAFLAEFDKKYLKPAMANIEEFKTMAGLKEAFGGRVQLLLATCGKIKKPTTLDILQKLRSGPIRGMLAAAVTVKGYDSQWLRDLWNPLDQRLNNLNTNSSQQDLNDALDAVHAAAHQSLSQGKNSGLF